MMRRGRGRTGSRKASRPSLLTRRGRPSAKAAAMISGPRPGKRSASDDGGSSRRAEALPTPINRRSTETNSSRPGTMMEASRPGRRLRKPSSARSNTARSRRRPDRRGPGPCRRRSRPSMSDGSASSRMDTSRAFPSAKRFAGDRFDARFEEPSSHRPGDEPGRREYGRRPRDLRRRTLGLDDGRQREAPSPGQGFEELGEAVFMPMPMVR